VVYSLAVGLKECGLVGPGLGLDLAKMVFTFVTGRDPGVTLVQSTTQAAHTAARLRALQSGQDRLPYNHSPSACRWHDGRAHRPQFNENETKW